MLEYFVDNLKYYLKSINKTNSTTDTRKITKQFIMSFFSQI